MYKDKNCKTKSNICLVGGLQEYPDLHGQLQEQRIITFLPGSGQHHEVCNKHPHPSPLCIKETWIITQIKWVIDMKNDINKTVTITKLRFSFYLTSKDERKKEKKRMQLSE